MLPKTNKANIEGNMEAIEKYLRSCHSVIRAPLAYVIRKTILVKTYGDYPKYATPDNEMFVRILHLPLDTNKLHNEISAQSVNEFMAEYEIDKRSASDILHQICKDTNLYPYVKHHKSKRNGRGSFCAIHSRWPGPNDVNMTASQLS